MRPRPISAPLPFSPTSHKAADRGPWALGLGIRTPPTRSALSVANVSFVAHLRLSPLGAVPACPTRHAASGPFDMSGVQVVTVPVITVPPCSIVGRDIATHSVHAVSAVQGGLVTHVAAVFPRPRHSTSPTSVARCTPSPVTTTPPVISTAVALALMAFFALPDQDTPWYYISGEYLLCSESHD